MFQGNISEGMNGERRVEERDAIHLNKIHFYSKILWELGKCNTNKKGISELITVFLWNVWWIKDSEDYSGKLNTFSKVKEINTQK